MTFSLVVVMRRAPAEGKYGRQLVELGRLRFPELARVLPAQVAFDDVLCVGKLVQSKRHF